MRQGSVGRRLSAAVAVMVLGTAGVVVGPVGTARAGGSPVRVEESSGPGIATEKSATVSCPGEATVVAPGARVVGGGGAVVLTSMAPDPELTSVTVTARARSGFQGSWSVLAMAVCDLGVPAPVVAPQTVSFSSSVTATCPDGARLTGTGFRVHGDVDHVFVNGVAFGPQLRQLSVQTGGTGTPLSLTAVAICKGGMISWDRVEGVRAFDGTWPVTAVASDTSNDRMYGVGAVVQSEHPVFLSALVPDPDNDRAIAEAVRASTLPGQLQARVDRGGSGPVATENGDDGSLTVFGGIGTFH